MGKRFWSLMLSMALVGGVFSVLPANAQEAPPLREIPATTNIVDEHEDANGLTPQGGPAGGATFGRADIWAGWFSTDADTISAHIQTAVGGRGNYPYFYRVRVDPGDGSNCLWLTGTVPSAVDPGAPSAQLRNTCGGVDERTPGELVLEAGPEETGVFTIKFPRSAHPAFVDGSVLKAPWAEVTQSLGTSATGGATAPVIDMTEAGTDYTVGRDSDASGPGEPSEPTEPPGKGDPPGKGKKKGCPKGKGQKKGACAGKKKPKPPVASCAPYTPGEDGAEAETSVVTDAATEEKPVVVEYEAEMGGPSSPLVDAFDFRSFVFHNVQVDSANPDVGLYVKTEFTEFHDYDLALFHADGTEAASSGQSQPVGGAGGGSPDGAWEGGSNYEFLKGIRTADCAGYTARVAGYLTSGGPVTISMWLGPVVGDPTPPGDGELASDIFFNALGMRSPLG